jgi:hypothetical protein
MFLLVYYTIYLLGAFVRQKKEEEENSLFMLAVMFMLLDLFRIRKLK